MSDVKVRIRAVVAGSQRIKDKRRTESIAALVTRSIVNRMAERVVDIKGQLVFQSLTQRHCRCVIRGTADR